MASLFPPWHPPFRPRLLLILPLLPLPLPPHFPHLLLHPPQPPPLLLPPLQPLHPHFPFVVTCQIVLLGCNFLCHVGVLLLHFLKSGCNGIGAWGFNSVLDVAILLLFLNFYVKMHLERRKIADFDAIKDGDIDTNMAKNKDI
ncbi:hypothetical protein CsSME_00052527 [Camellia sinensis var. sinensis]